MLSKALGYLIILGSLIVKVPQILKILQSNSVEGLSLEMFVLEIVGYSILFYSLSLGLLTGFLRLITLVMLFAHPMAFTDSFLLALLVKLYLLAFKV